MDHLTKLLLAAQSGDRHALERFVVESQHDVAAVCRYLGDADNADDLVQETYAGWRVAPAREQVAAGMREWSAPTAMQHEPGSVHRRPLSG